MRSLSLLETCSLDGSSNAPIMMITSPEYAGLYHNSMKYSTVALSVLEYFSTLTPFKSASLLGMMALEP